MKITDILSSSSSPYPSFEIVPPKKGISKDELFASIAPLMEFCPRYINVTCHREEVDFREEPDGTFTRHLARHSVGELAVCAAVSLHFGVEVVPHLICAGTTEDRLESLLEDFSFMGVENVMALRGDALNTEKRFVPTPGGYAHASELVAAIRAHECREGKAPMCVGVGAYPEKHREAANMEQDIRNLKKKIDMGADYIITQMFFDNALYYNFVNQCREAGITLPIIPGIKPLSALRQISLLPESFSIDIPEDLVREVQTHPDCAYEIGTEWAVNQTKDLIAHGVGSVHYYTMGKAQNVSQIVKKCF